MLGCDSSASRTSPDGRPLLLSRPSFAVTHRLRLRRYRTRLTCPSTSIVPGRSSRTPSRKNLSTWLPARVLHSWQVKTIMHLSGSQSLWRRMFDRGLLSRCMPRPRSVLELVQTYWTLVIAHPAKLGLSLLFRHSLVLHHVEDRRRRKRRRSTPDTRSDRPFRPRTPA